MGLTEREQRKVEDLVEKLEAFNAEWMTWACELADLRRVPVNRLLKELSIQRPAYV